MITNTQKLGFSISGDDKKDKYEKLKDTVNEELKKAFRPEFLNRVDDIIVFSKLKQDEIKIIAERMLETLKQRLQSLGITISFDTSAVLEVANSGFDEIYGARPLRRAIQTNIEDKLSELILEGKIKAGNRVICGFENGEYKFINE